MYRVIAGVVVVITVAWVAQLVLSLSALSAGGVSELGVRDVTAVLVVVLLLAILSWFLIGRSLRAWRDPTVENVRALYVAFAVVVGLVTYGAADDAVEAAGNWRYDFIEVVLPLAAAVAMGGVVYAALRRWAVPKEDSTRPAGSSE